MALEQAWIFLKAVQTTDDRPCDDCAGSGWSTKGQERDRTARLPIPQRGEYRQTWSQGLTPPEIPCDKCQTGRNLAVILDANKNPTQTNMSTRLANIAELERHNERVPHPTTPGALQEYWNPEMAAAYRLLEEKRNWDGTEEEYYRMMENRAQSGEEE